ncbi:flagellar assembly protein FliW [Bacillus fonticola]|uniref:flagellar assembly protein FliW n=1 Tax=Bacillus fonticola TaxID=2728853 RepID=UPI001473E9B6|nr:flagellar assembly protein FliW [Bacillus fonticola]
MNIETKYHDTIQIEANQIYTFQRGIPGFPEEHQFTILQLTDDGMYQVLQSINTPMLAFVITNPFAFLANYEFTLDEPTVEQLHLENEEEAQIFVIVTVTDPFDQSTANFQAPIICNVRTKEGKQVVLNEGNYAMKQPLITKTAAEKG